jgi:hypothetical protein
MGKCAQSGRCQPGPVSAEIRPAPLDARHRLTLPIQQRTHGSMDWADAINGLLDSLGNFLAGLAALLAWARLLLAHGA